jgi:transcriptional regulator with XRE-family HTH domain
MKITHLTPETAILKELGRRLARVRKARGFSQDRLAGEAGIGVATLRRIEGGQDSQLESWLKILKALDMAPSVDALLPEDLKSPLAEARAAQLNPNNPTSPRHRATVSETRKEPSSFDALREDES